MVGCATGGIGAASARLLASEGWQLALVDIAVEPLRALAAAIGVRAAISVDATDPDALAAAGPHQLEQGAFRSGAFPYTCARRPFRPCVPRGRAQGQGTRDVAQLG